MTTIGGFFRYFGGYAIAFYMPAFFNGLFPLHKEDYGVANAFVVSLCCLFSSVFGGYISDYYEKKGLLLTKAYVCIISAFLGIITFSMCTLIQSSFWFSIIMLGLEYAVAEAWIP